MEQDLNENTQEEEISITDDPQQEVFEEKADDKEEDKEEDIEETIITIEDKPLESNDSNVLRNLRSRYKEKDKRVRELEKRLAEIESPEKVIERPKRPRIADFDYDDEKYEKAMDDYLERSRVYTEHQNRQLQEEKLLQESYKSKQEQYNNKKNSLKLKDYEDAEEIVKATLSTTQQGIIIDSADNPAILVYALGKSPEKLKELSEIKNPIHYLKAIVKMESQIKTIETRRPNTSPEKILSGGKSAQSSAKYKELERLRDKGRKTGDFTDAVRYRKTHKL